MADTPPNPDPRFPNRRPAAAVVGGQRRRGRRPPGGVPRANATPTFDSILGADTAGTTHETHQQPAVPTRDLRHLEPLRLPSMNFYPPISGIPADYRPSTTPGPSSSANDETLLTPTSTSTTSTTDGKKKHRMFSNFKSHGQDRSSPSQAMLTPSSPLPPDTPGKAARMLGLPAGMVAINERPDGHDDAQDEVDDDDQGEEEEVNVRRSLNRQVSMPVLTKFKELDIEPDPPKKKKFSWGKAGKKWDALTSPLKPRSQTEPENEPAATSNSWYQFMDSTNDVFSDDFLPTEPPPPAPEASSRRSGRNKNRQGVQQMSPIVENSHDDHRSPYQHSASVPDLGVIPEYRGLNNPPPPVPHRHAQRPGHSLDAFDPSASDNITRGHGGIGGPSTRNRRRVPFNQVELPQQPAVPERGPVQKFELFTEETLEEYKKKAAEWEAARLQTDEEVRALKAKHEEMKKEFAALLKARDDMEGGGEGEGDEDDDDDDDPVSLRSSIDLSEEPTLHTAIAMPILRVTPGMVKLVDIPPRKK